MSAVLVIFAIVSCSDDASETMTQNQTVQQTTKARGTVTGFDYAKSFYKANVAIGESVTIVDDEGTQILLEEVIVSYGTRARGYIVTNRVTNEFLYFGDVDRTNYKLTVYEAKSSQLFKFNEINKSDDYSSTNEFDYVTYAKKPKGFWRLFGWGKYAANEPCGSDGKVAVHRYHYFLGLTWGGAPDYNYIPCGDVGKY